MAEAHGGRGFPHSCRDVSKLNSKEKTILATNIKIFYKKYILPGKSICSVGSGSWRGAPGADKSELLSSSG